MGKVEAAEARVVEEEEVEGAAEVDGVVVGADEEVGEVDGCSMTDVVGYCT